MRITLVKRGFNSFKKSKPAATAAERQRLQAEIAQSLAERKRLQAKLAELVARKAAAAKTAPLSKGRKLAASAK